MVCYGSQAGSVQQRHLVHARVNLVHAHVNSVYFIVAHAPEV
jgi:hypothetical protein